MKQRRIFVISDLHLGGKPSEDDQNIGFQLCGQEGCQRLTEFVEWIRDYAPSNTWQKDDNNDWDVELVINGDMVDFLAEENHADSHNRRTKWDAFTEPQERAQAKLERIIRERSGGFFPALREFLNREGHYVTLIIGNHDVELALPKVKQWLISYLTQNKIECRGRLSLIFDGLPYRIGPVFIAHGNREDSFNRINHGQIRTISSAYEYEEPPQEKFTPPEGSLLVIRAINPLKTKYKFVDLLKPETAAVVPFLRYLDSVAFKEALKKVASHLQGIGMIKILRRKPTSGEQKASSTSQPASSAICDIWQKYVKLPTTEVFTSIPFSDLPQHIHTYLNNIRESIANVYGGDYERADYFLAQLLDSKEPIPLLDGYQSAKETEAWIKWGLGIIFGNTVVDLQDALKVMSKDRSFEISYEVPPYWEAAQRLLVKDAIECVIFGHTHLPKKIDLEKTEISNRWYINTGTWCGIIKLPEETLSESGKKILDAFAQDLRENQLKNHIKFRPTYALIELASDFKQLMSSPELLQFDKENPRNHEIKF